MSERAVRVYRYEVVRFSGDNRKRWWFLCDAVRQMTNLFWREWESYHTQHDSHSIVSAFANDLADYRKKQRAEKPKLELQAVPTELSKRIYRKMADNFPAVHNRVAGLLQQAIRKKMTGKGSDGKWSMWQAILMDRQGRPSATRPQPIPFDSKSAKIVRSENGFDLQIRLTRLPSDKKACLSIEDSCGLKVKHGNGRAVIERVVSGEYKFCGSSLVYDEKNRKWFVNVCYQMPKASTTQGVGVARLFPSRAYPFVLMLNGRTIPLERLAEPTAHVRKTVMTNRWERKRGYQYASSNRKSHGRKRAMSGIEKLSLRWRHFTKSANHEVSKEVVRKCFEAGIGKLIFMQPGGDKAQNRMIATVGKVDGMRDKTAWDYAQLKSMLAYKCQDCGIQFEAKVYGVEGKAVAVA